MTAALTSVGVQQVSITIANGATTGTATITAVGSGAFIVWKGQTTTDTSTATSAMARIELTNATTVTATRNTSSTDTVTINAVIVDGDTTNLIKSVQSGTTTISTAATTGTSTISAVTNANTAIFFLGSSTASIANLLRDDCKVTLSGTTVTATRSASSGACIVGWCVVEFQGAALNSSTQAVSIATTASGTSFSTTITSVTTANTMLAYGGFIPVVSVNPAKDFPRISLASATSVQADYNTLPGSTGGGPVCTVIEFVSGVLAQAIQRGAITVTSATSNTATITSAATSQTLVNYLGNSTAETTFDLATANHRITQTNATTITETINSSSTGTGSYEAITFNSVSAGIAFDAASNSTYQAAASSYSWSHTCTGANCYLSVEIAMLSLAQTVTSITYNGALLEFLGAQNSITGAARIELWGIPNPASGTNTIAVTLSGSIASAGVASSYTGVNQSSPTESFNSAQATNVGAADATVTITTVSDNCWIIAAVATDDTSITSNNTSRNKVTGAGGSGANSDNNAAKTPAGAVTMSWTGVGALATWAILGIALRPVADATLDIGWFPIYSDQSRLNLKVQRDFFFAGIPKLNFPMPWIPRYPDQVPFFNQQIPSGQVVEPVQPLNFPMPWLPSYPNQVPFFVQQRPSGQATEPVFPLNFPLKWLPTYPNQVPFFVQPVASGQSVEPVPSVVVNTPLPWLPIYADTYRPFTQPFRNFIFEPVIPLNLPLPWLPSYPNQVPFFVQQLPSGQAVEPIQPLNFSMPWLPEYTDLPRPVIQPFRNSFFSGIPPLNLPIPWLPSYPNQAPFFVQQIPSGQSVEPIQPLSFTTPWMPSYPSAPLPVPSVQDTNAGFSIKTVTPIINIGWFPVYPASYPGIQLSASTLAGFFGPPFIGPTPPASGLVCHIGHILSHPGVACLGFGVATDKNGSI